jgi:hypothetical protein
VIGWPDLPSPDWATPSSARRVIGDGPFLDLIHPALVALERLNAEGESIRVETPSPGLDADRSRRGLPPLFPYLIPSWRTN